MGFPRQGYWTGLPFPFPGIFPTQGSDPHLLHCRWILYHWDTRETPRSHCCPIFENYISFLYNLDSEHGISKISQVITQNTNFVRIHTEDLRLRTWDGCRELPITKLGRLKVTPVFMVWYLGVTKGAEIRKRTLSHGSGPQSHLRTESTHRGSKEDQCPQNTITKAGSEWDFSHWLNEAVVF